MRSGTYLRLLQNQPPPPNNRTNTTMMMISVVVLMVISSLTLLNVCPSTERFAASPRLRLVIAFGYLALSLEPFVASQAVYIWLDLAFGLVDDIAYCLPYLYNVCLLCIMTKSIQISNASGLPTSERKSESWNRPLITGD
jgi:hypothetical protein